VLSLSENVGKKTYSVTYLSVFLVSFLLCFDNIIDLCDSIVPAVVYKSGSLMSHGTSERTFDRCIVLDIVRLLQFRGLCG
jgi:hypothetical protein